MISLVLLSYVREKKLWRGRLLFNTIESLDSKRVKPRRWMRYSKVLHVLYAPSVALARRGVQRPPLQLDSRLPRLRYRISAPRLQGLGEDLLDLNYLNAVGIWFCQ